MRCLWFCCLRLGGSINYFLFCSLALPVRRQLKFLLGENMKLSDIKGLAQEVVAVLNAVIGEDAAVLEKYHQAGTVEEFLKAYRECRQEEDLRLPKLSKLNEVGIIGMPTVYREKRYRFDVFLSYDDGEQSDVEVQFLLAWDKNSFVLELYSVLIP